MNITGMKAFSRIMAVSIVLGLAVSASPAIRAGASTEKVIQVRDYGAIPDDGIDDSEAIQNAINDAIYQQIPVVSLQAGTYNFSEDPLVGTAENAYIHVMAADHLQISGAVDSQGNPATKWVRFNTGEPAADLRQLLFVGYASDVTISNLVIDNDPYYYSAGKIVSVEGDRVTVDVLEGHPRWDGMKAFLPGSYDFVERRFIRQRIIWTPDNGNNAPVMHTEAGGDGRLMYVDSPEIARVVNAGEGLFWFQGNYTPSAQMIMNYNATNILYENVRILNATGFALTSDYCTNITYRKVSLAPEGNRIATAPRDGFNIANAAGDVLMDQITIDGTCDDGQNCHGFWTTIQKKIDDYTILANAFPYAQMPLIIGSIMKITSGKTMEYIWEGRIKRYQYDSGRNIEIEFDRSLPNNIDYSPDFSIEKRSMLEPDCWFPDSYIVKDSVIRNTYRGLKTANANVQVYNCTFEYNQYDIFLGAESDPYFLEGRHPSDVFIHDNVFRQSNSGTGIALDFINFPSLHPTGVMSNIRIYDNTFLDQRIGIDITDTRNSFFYGNEFIRCVDDFSMDRDTTENLYYAAPSGTPDSDQEPAKPDATIFRILYAAIITVSVYLIFLLLFYKKIQAKRKIMHSQSIEMEKNDEKDSTK